MKKVLTTLTALGLLSLAGCATGATGTGGGDEAEPLSSDDFAATATSH